jgi:glutamate 5-kinase
VVIKIGTNTLAQNGGIDTAYFAGVARQVKALLKGGRQIVIVTSGAIGMGAGQLHLAEKPREMKMRQACAAIGQPLLMQEYRQAFERDGVRVAQVLLTAEVLTNRKTYLNLRNAIETLLGLGVVPILNENDSVSTAEIGTAFGDNDRLSALVASKIDADLLILLTDIDALYDKNPKQHADARPVPVVFEITDQIVRSASGQGSVHSTGGMKTKIEAARIAANAGCRIVLAHGRERDVVTRILAGEPLGTIFLPRRKLSNRARWILNSRPAGTIRIDAGALKALRNHKSLLPSGVTGIEGSFDAGEVVLLVCPAGGEAPEAGRADGTSASCSAAAAQAVASLGSVQLKTLAGKHSTEIKKLLGPRQRDVVALPEDIVFLDQ